MSRRGFATSVVVNTTSTIILSGNPHRHDLLISNNGANPVLISFGQKATATNGILLPISNRPYEFHRAQWGDLVSQDIFGIATTAASSVAVLAGEDCGMPV